MMLMVVDVQERRHPRFKTLIRLGLEHVEAVLDYIHLSSIDIPDGFLWHECRCLSAKRGISACLLVGTSHETS